MKIYVYRFWGYIFLSMFLALAFGPFGGNPLSKPYHPRYSFGIHLDSKEMELRHFVDQAITLDGTRQPEIENILQKTQFKFSRYILVAVFLLSGLVFIRKAYKRQPGIILNPRWATVAGDVIFIFFLGFAAYCVIDYGLKKFTGASLYLYDPIAIGMGAAAYVPVTAFCCYFASNFSCQSIEIGDNGIRVHYPEKVQSVPWEDIQGFELKETYAVAG